MLARCCFALGLALTCGADCRAARGDVDLPADFAVAPVAQRMVINGLPLEVVMVSAALAPQRACGLIAGQWSGARSAVVLGCRKSGEWLLITRRAGWKVQTAQLRESAGGAVGFISQLDLRAQVSKAALPRIPLPFGTRVLNVLQSTGPEGESVQFTLRMPLPPAAVLRQFSIQAGRLGWQIVQPSAQPPREGMFEFKRGAERIQAIVARCAGGSGVVLLEQASPRHQP